MAKRTAAELVAQRLEGHEYAGSEILRATWIFLRRYARSRPATVALVVTVGVVFVAIFADLLTSRSPTSVDLTQRFQPPLSPGYFLGSDTLGRDILTRVVHGSRVSLGVSTSAALISLVMGVLLGLLAGIKGGWVDSVMMRIVDGQVGFPFLVVAVTVLAMIGGSTLTLIILLGYWGWTLYARVVRGEVLSIKEAEYVTAARAIGASGWRIAFRHVLPNTLAPVVVLVSFSLPALMVVEASLSFLGLGISPPTPSWGNMLSGSREHLEYAWWLAVVPGVTLSLVVLAFNVVGDRLRDIVDPRLRGVTY